MRLTNPTINYLLTAQFSEQPVSDKLDVLLHEFGIHTDHAYGQSVRQEFLLDQYRVHDDLCDALL